jgi:hypothetical protein
MRTWLSLLLIISMSCIALLTPGAAIAQEVRPSHTDPGWQASYWRNPSLSGAPAVERFDPDLNFSWGMGSPDPAIGADGFSARWLRYIDVTPGTYRFTATSDDGMRVWVDDELIIDMWSEHAALTRTADRYLGPGHHLIKVEYFENAGAATAQLSWAMTTEPPPDPSPTGWRGEYFNNLSLSGSPALIRTDPEINFNWNGSPAPGRVEADYFSVRWSRMLDLPAGNYRFTVVVDDGARLFVNGHTLIDAWREQGPTPYSGDIYLPGGPVTVQMEYFEQRGGAVAQLRWERSDGSPSQWRHYRNERYGVEFDYPASWQPEGGDSTRYEGSDGFFVLNASGGGLERAVQNEINHRLRPYGSHPSVESLTAGGQPARLILPDWDQPAGMRDQAALVVQYPQPVQIGGYHYSIFVLYASEPHIRRMADSLAFLGQRPPTGNAIIVDDRDPGFVRGGNPRGWRVVGEGYNGRLTWSQNNDRVRPQYNWARWYPQLRRGSYEVYVYIPDRYTTTAAARYWVSHADGQTLRIVDQSAHGGEWVSLGVFRFQGNKQDYVSLADMTYEPYLSTLIAWDAVKWEPR